ncbi:tRNA epoxyqueuosine(34) reductase QueG [Selenihalanaerobacter shriftii]|uniref:Epoxyqueuosine reductase n=1 Tax=Selenihalanaerobacter shriftii TaxID=142842 RepID=A0A1T4JQY0_9FIRM|nr:tRNA epoxyqueuosine(34) reductase QueG [Selenihalanaerobacter shriftii]SJZ32533.1 epoxyqueuosine reductase [Selenihalanaerobacter shriftii]
MTLTEEIKRHAKEIGIDDIRITDTEPFLEIREFLKKAKEQGYLSKFVHDDLELITDPKQVISKAKTVIVCAISYKVELEDDEQSNSGLRGKLSRFAWGQDYHRVLGDKLDQLIDFLHTKSDQVQAKKFVDTGPTVDRALARRSGIGWQGKNCSIINPEYGSWIFIGGVITNLELEIDSELEKECGECRECIESCPTGALKDDYTLDSNRCLGYITLSKGYLDEKDRKKIGTRLWGCDTCQEVCCHNQEVKSGNHPEFLPQTIEAYPHLPSLLKLTNKEYKEKFMPTPMNWRGKRSIQRNAAVILGNLKDDKAVPHLIEGLNDPKPIVRAHSAWALGEIGEVIAVEALKKALDKEKDQEVIGELEKAINRLTR